MEPLATRSANAVPKPKPASHKETAVREDKAELDRKEQRARIHPEDPPRYVQEPCGLDGQEGQRYAVEGFLGAGGFAKCFQAELRDGRTRRTGERVALKVVRADMGSKKMREKFRSELQVHSKMHHPNIVEFHRSFTFKENTYVVLELCENRSLMEMVKARKYLTGPEVRAFTIQTAGAIKYMHLKNVIHRDLKMGNIFLDANMNIKVGDFGLAALLYSPEGRRTTICGTPNYIAPEILEKGKNGHNYEVDLWSLGIIIYAMLVGTPPFQANTQEDIYKKVRSRDYGWPPEEKRIIAKEAKDLVASLLVEAGNRLTPDDVVEHDFISSGFFLHEILPEYRYGPPELPNRTFMEKRSERVKYVETYEKLCRNAGVGKDINGRYWPCVGTDGGKEIISEIQEEDLKGLAPIPGSPSVYKGSKSALAARPGTKVLTFRDALPTITTACQQNGLPKPISIPTLPDVYKQPIRPKQSRAAELRELNRPATAAFPKSILKDMANRNEAAALQAPLQRPVTAAATGGGQGLLESAPRRPSPKDKVGQPENKRPDRPLTRSATASVALARPSDAMATRGAGVARSASAGAATVKPVREVEPPVTAMTKVTAKSRSEPLSEMMPKPAGTAREKVSAKPRSETVAETEPRPKDVADTRTETESIANVDAKTKAIAESRQIPPPPPPPPVELDPKLTTEPKRKRAARSRPEPPPPPPPAAAESGPETIAESKAKTVARLLRSDLPARLESNIAAEHKTNTTAKLGSELPAESVQKIVAGPKKTAVTTIKSKTKLRSKHLVEMEPPASAAEAKPRQKVVVLEGANADDKEQPSRERGGTTSSAPAQEPRNNNEVSKIEERPRVNSSEVVEGPPPNQPQTRSKKKQQATRLTFKQQTRLVSPRDASAEILPRTRPDRVLKGCVTLHTNLRKAMNHERYGEELAQVSPQLLEGKEPNYVVKWVDYTTRFGIGYILGDGTIGCLFNENKDPPTSVIVRAAERHVANWASADYADRHQIVPPAGRPIEFLESLGENGLVRAFVNPREFKVACGEGGMTEKLGPGKDSFDDLKRKQVALWRKFANYMSETLGKTEKEKYQNPGVKPTDTIVTFYQRFGDVGVWGFGDGSFQFNFPDHTKILISHDGLQCYFLHLPSRPAQALAKSGTPVPSEVLTGRSVMSYPTYVFFRGHADGKEFSDVMEANRFRSKMIFIRDVIGEWISLGGVGRGFEDPDKELKHWKGPREKRSGSGSSSGGGSGGGGGSGKNKDGKDPATKLVWVTVGARGGDEPALETLV
ncbi:hypothetical protein GP486_006151 [Trichoglossum hirsutum]|uniref:Protein kinase domain-containing protein n=1 Tax=Trichoglossum hirsutum TaxID=265104 RepID=A0A9P8L7W8_9PEZI|nr:hypothetical protein GP486_006151 [Trichoglossum hirsutum]